MLYKTYMHADPWSLVHYYHFRPKANWDSAHWSSLIGYAAKSNALAESFLPPLRPGTRRHGGYIRASWTYSEATLEAFLNFLEEVKGKYAVTDSELALALASANKTRFGYLNADTLVSYRKMRREGVLPRPILRQKMYEVLAALCHYCWYVPFMVLYQLDRNELWGVIEVSGMQEYYRTHGPHQKSL